MTCNEGIHTFNTNICVWSVYCALLPLPGVVLYSSVFLVLMKQTRFLCRMVCRRPVTFPLPLKEVESLSMVAVHDFPTKPLKTFPTMQHFSVSNLWERICKTVFLSLDLLTPEFWNCDWKPQENCLEHQSDLMTINTNVVFLYPCSTLPQLYIVALKLWLIFLTTLRWWIHLFSPMLYSTCVETYNRVLRALWAQVHKSQSRPQSPISAKAVGKVTFHPCWSSKWTDFQFIFFIFFCLRCHLVFYNIPPLHRHKR